MTAEVGVMNRIGIALAADSAVTIGRDADKIYTSADKLFHLSPSAPVGVMINDNANYLGVPWETIIKTYRAQFGDTRFDKLDEYAKSFIGFIQGNRSLFPAVQQDQIVVSMAVSLLLNVREHVERRLDREAEEQDGLDDNDYPPIIADVVKNRLDVIRESDKLSGLPSSARSAIRKRYSSKISDIRKVLFGKLDLTAATSRNLITIVVEMLVRHYFGPFRSGVVIAGFGEKEYMPRLVAYDFEEMVLNRPRCVESQRVEISHNNSASILPFAQQEMVHSFLRGIDPALSAHHKESTSMLFLGAISKIFDKIEAETPSRETKLAELIAPEVQGLLKELFDGWNTKSEEFWRPVVQNTASLPKEELAAMAEALVNLTKFRRRIGPERETVAGPIDVAVITKGDGFVWVKRKHYFDPDLNPRVIARYGQGG